MARRFRTRRLLWWILVCQQSSGGFLIIPNWTIEILRLALSRWTFCILFLMDLGLYSIFSSSIYLFDTSRCLACTHWRSIVRWRLENSLILWTIRLYHRWTAKSRRLVLRRENGRRLGHYVQLITKIVDIIATETKWEYHWGGGCYCDEDRKSVV